MCKREVIDEIMRINLSARPGFLAEFALEDLQDYLKHLQAAQMPRPLACLYATGIPASSQHMRQSQLQEPEESLVGAQGGTLF